MSRRHVSFALALPLALAFAAPRAAPDDGQKDRMLRVAGVLVDAEGNPVADARVSDAWDVQALVPLSFYDLDVDDAGRFSGEIEVWREPFGLVAYTADGALAGYVSAKKAEAGELKIVMKPTVRVTAEVTCTEMGRPPKHVSVMWNLGSQRLGNCNAEDGSFEACLPQGEVSYWAYDSYFATAEGTLTLDGSQPTLDLGAIDLPGSFIEKNLGQVLPAWTVTEARGVDVEKAQIADFRGKWLLIEFWGHW